MTHKVRALIPMLTYVDIGKAIAFYQSIGFQLEGTDEFHYGEGKINWAMLSLDEIRIMLSINGRAGPKPDQSFYLAVEDADAFYEKVQGKVTIKREIGDQFYGVRDFWFTDPFGYEWGAGHELEAEKPA